MPRSWSNLARGKDGKLVPVEHGTGRARQITQRASRRLVRQAGGDPLTDGVTSVAITASAFAAVARSPRSMRQHFERMSTERKAFRDWKKQTSKIVG